VQLLKGRDNLGKVMAIISATHPCNPTPTRLVSVPVSQFVRSLVPGWLEIDEVRKGVHQYVPMCMDIYVPINIFSSVGACAHG